MKKNSISVDFELLCVALESDGNSYVNLRTGEILILGQEGMGDELADQEHKLVRKDKATFELLNQLPTNVAFGIMESFVQKAGLDKKTQASLTKALKSAGPFRHFKDVVNENLELRDKWFAFKRKEMEYWAAWCLRKQSILADIVDRMKEKPEGREQASKAKISRSESLLLSELLSLTLSNHRSLLTAELISVELLKSSNQ